MEFNIYLHNLSKDDLSEENLESLKRVNWSNSILTEVNTTANKKGLYAYQTSKAYKDFAKELGAVQNMHWCNPTAFETNKSSQELLANSLNYSNVIVDFEFTAIRAAENLTLKFLDFVSTVSPETAKITFSYVPGNWKVRKYYERLRRKLLDKYLPALVDQMLKRSPQMYSAYLPKNKATHAEIFRPKNYQEFKHDIDVKHFGTPTHECDLNAYGLNHPANKYSGSRASGESLEEWEFKNFKLAYDTLVDLGYTTFNIFEAKFLLKNQLVIDFLASESESLDFLKKKASELLPVTTNGSLSREITFFYKNTLGVYMADLNLNSLSEKSQISILKEFIDDYEYWLVYGSNQDY